MLDRNNDNENSDDDNNHFKSYETSQKEREKLHFVQHLKVFKAKT